MQGESFDSCKNSHTMIYDMHCVFSNFIDWKQSIRLGVVLHFPVCALHMQVVMWNKKSSQEIVKCNQKLSGCVRNKFSNISIKLLFSSSSS